MSPASAAQPLRDTFLPFSLPLIEADEIAEVVDTLRSGWLTTGPKTRRFEEEFAAALGVRHAIAVNSNTAGLHTSLAAMDIGPGDEVIVPTLTFCATANVVVHTGATPVIVDCRDDFNIDPAAIERAITPRTRAIMPVHYSGQSADMDEVLALAAARNLRVIEDAAHAIGVSYRGRKLGTLGSTGVFSFYATKNITTGEGGMIVTNDDALADRMRRLALHGMDRNAWKRFTAEGSWYYEVTEAGFKYNMTDLQASLGLHQLKKVARFNARRADIAQRYGEAFANLPMDLPVIHGDREHNWHLYVIRLALDALSIDRAAFIAELARRKIGASVHYVPLHLHPYYRDTYGLTREQYPMASATYDRMLSLPLFPAMTDDDVNYVIAHVREICAEHAT